MSRSTILHMFSSADNLSPFDVNMAIDAGWEHCIPYTALETGQIRDLVQDAIFSRGPKGVKRTGAFIGGRDIHVATEMLNLARDSMVPPFEISVFADPSGAFTTAAGMVASAEQHLKQLTGESLNGRHVAVFGGTGPVGMTCAMLAAQSGARAVIISHATAAKAQRIADECSERYGVTLHGAGGSDDAAIMQQICEAEIVFNAAKAGVQVLAERHLAGAENTRIFCDVNAVPPAGIAGVGPMDDGVVLEGTPRGALGIGALAVGNIKYQTQHELLRQMVETDSPVYLSFEQALDTARSLG